MWPRFHRRDFGMIAHYLGTIILLLGVIMLIPLAVSLLMQEWSITSHYLIGVGVAVTVGGLLRLGRISPGQLERRQAIAVTGLVWLIGAAIAAVPLWFSGHYNSFLDAFFEGVSGFTATGMTMCVDLDHLSTADNMWRFIMQFLGGQGVVVIALSLGVFSKVGSSFYNAEGREEFVLPNVKRTAQFIWRFSSLVVLCGTAVLFVAMMLRGIEPVRSVFHALWVTIGSYDTGGFAPQSTSLMYYHSWTLEITAMVLMMLGAINFALYAQILGDNRRTNLRTLLSDLEIRTLASWIVFMLLVFVAAICAGEFLDDYSGLVRRGVFTIISATTNAGYQVLTTNQMTTLLTSGSFFLLIMAMAIGGSSGSTAGGMKALRIGIVARNIVSRIKDVLAPQSARNTTSYTHLGRHLLTNELTGAAMTIVLLYIISYIVGALFGIAAGYEAIPATFESVSATSNAGLSAGIATPEAPVYMKVVYIIQMWMGRLEFLTLLALVCSVVASLKPRRRGVEK
ncbi:MAG: hypothetical protein LBR39_04260 [Coriobacteriales bacterium]|jgi:trk system potassium uptake protein TrkH|nr:hypothetical protein [Coriobacteriales bacterium]